MRKQDFDFIITIDSGCDLSMSVCKKNNIIPLQMNYVIDNQQVVDTLEDKEYKEYSKQIKKGSSFMKFKANAYVYLDFWYKLLSSHKSIIHICSSLDSRNYDNALIAKRMICEQFSEIQIHVVDSKNISLGSGMLALYASILRSNGSSFEETVCWIEENKLNVNNVIASTKFTNKALKKKTLAKQLANGTIKELESTYLSNRFESAVKKELSDYLVNPSEQTLFVCSYDNDVVAQNCGEQIKKMFGFKNVYYGAMNPVSANSFNPDTIALFFFGKKRG